MYINNNINVYYYVSPSQNVNNVSLRCEFKRFRVIHIIIIDDNKTNHKQMSKY